MKKGNASSRSKEEAFLILRNPRVLYPVPDFRALRVVKTLNRTDKVAGDPADTLESHTFTYPAVYNRKRFPFIIFHFISPYYRILFSKMEIILTHSLKIYDVFTLNSGGDCLPSLSLW